MADFHQSGTLSTFHRFRALDLDRCNEELKQFSAHRPVTLILPTIYDELEGEALGQIIDELNEVTYLHKIIVTMGQTNEEQFQHALDYFKNLQHDSTVLWATGPRIQSLIDLLTQNDLSPGPDGKGRSVWFAFGYALSDVRTQVIALHDCDILTYTRELLARLCYPVTSPNLSYEYNKGYYARVTNRMHGRVTRLLITPLVRALIQIIGTRPYLHYLESYRYALSGEFCLVRDLARVIRIPSDWGLEIGMLSEVYRNCSINRICQTELCELYEHKHQPLSPDDPEKGLMKMCVDITKTIFRQLGTEGIILSEGFFRTLRIAYLRTAQEMITRYENDSAINGLDFDRHAEALAVESFTDGIQIAAETFLENPLNVTFIPTWTRVTSAIPDFLGRLQDAVQLDNQ